MNPETTAKWLWRRVDEYGYETLLRLGTKQSRERNIKRLICVVRGGTAVLCKVCSPKD